MAYFDSVLYPDRSFLGEAGFCAPNRPSPFSGSIIRTGGVKFLRQLCALGANVTLLKNAIRTRATDERSPKLRGRIHQCLRANSLTPAASSMLRERLGVYTSVPRGVGRGKMGPATRHRYSSKAHSLTTDLESNLFWLYNAIGRLRQRAIPITPIPSMGAFGFSRTWAHRRESAFAERCVDFKSSTEAVRGNGICS